MLGGIGVWGYVRKGRNSRNSRNIIDKGWCFLGVWQRACYGWGRNKKTKDKRLKTLWETRD
jgi:hypothetical protein